MTTIIRGPRTDRSSDWNHGYCHGIITGLLIAGRAGDETTFRAIMDQTFDRGQLIAVAMDDPDSDVWDYLDQYGYLEETEDETEDQAVSN